MTLPASPPKFDSWAELVSSIKVGEAGWRAYALQTALNSLHGEALVEDGAFGPATEAAVRRFQSAYGLTADGIAGAQTQRQLVSIASSRTTAQVSVPSGLMRGFAEGEGANVLAATNWSVPGGVDCGCMQIRVYGPPYAQAGMKTAFDPLEAMVRAARALVGRADVYYNYAWVKAQGVRRHEAALRCAILAHNWPAGAEDVAQTGKCSNPSGLASWAPSSAVFPDGTRVRTRWEWCEFYAMGGPHGEGAIPKYVTSWG